VCGVGCLSGLTFLPDSEWAVIGSVLNAGTIEKELVIRVESLVLVSLEFGKAPLVRDVDLLSAWELELGTTQGLDNLGLVLILGANRHDRLADVDACHGAERLAEGTTHARLQTIGACARQHLVDAEHVERMHAHTNVKGVLAAVLHQVLVAADTSGLEGLRRQLLVLVRDKVNAEWELIAPGLLATQIKDTDLWIWNTSAVS